jgi:acyl-CoA synthetase (NDP forming)
VAIIGASGEPDKIGGRPLSMSMAAGFPGTIYPINQKSAVVQGLKAYASLSEIPGPIDCAILAIPAPLVAQQLEAAAAAGARVAIVYAANFAEIGEAGFREQEEIAAIGRTLGLRILGPNCMGAFDVRARFYPTFLQAFDHFGGKGWPTAGSVGIASQSGAIGAHIFVMFRDRQVGISRFVTTGNQCDIEIADCIECMALDSDTRVIAVYLEGVKHGDRLQRALSLARTQGKPVVILKVGTSRAGSLAIASHTASLAGEDAIYQALFRKHGAFRATALGELVDVAIACEAGLYPASKEVGVISLSGGGGVILADACEQAGFTLPPMPDLAQKKMREIVPFCAPRNPVDPGAPAMTDISLTLRFLEISVEQGGYSTIFLFLTHLGYVERMMTPLSEGLRTLRQRYPERLLAIVLLGPPEVCAGLRKDGFLVFEEPLSAVRTIAALASIALHRNRPPMVSDLPDLPPISIPASTKEIEARQILRKVGLPVAPEIVVRSPIEASEASRIFGCPVSLKISSASLPHKADVGGVILDVTEPAGAAAAYRELIERWKRLKPDESPDEVLVSPMISGGVETILGARVDPLLGPIVMFGRGGVHAETNPDVVIRLAPISLEEAIDMIKEVRSLSFLDGRNGHSQFDIASAADALSRLSVLVAQYAAEIESIDVNPFIVLPDLKGGFAVDALIVPRRMRPEDAAQVAGTR